MGGGLGIGAGGGAAARPLVAARARRWGRAAALVFVAGTAACSGGGQAVQPLPAPPSTAARPPTTPPPDYRAVTLPVAPRGRTTTTVLSMGPGLATVRGRVVDPDGVAVVGANVRVERLVGSAVAGMDLISGEDGAWSVPNVLGGRYRIRAWRSPDLAMVVPAFVFVEARQTAPVEQKLARYTGTTPVPAIAPNPPVVGQPASLVMQVTSRSVDADGVVQGVPVAFTPVALAAATWSVTAPNATTTDAAGRVRWEVVCRQAGAQPLRLVVNSAEQFEVALPACAAPPTPVDPATTSTTRAGVTTTTRPGGPPTTRPVTTTRPRTP